MSSRVQELIDMKLVDVPYLEKYDVFYEMQELLKEEHTQIKELRKLLTIATRIISEAEPLTVENELDVYEFFKERDRLLREGFYYED